MQSSESFSQGSLFDSSPITSQRGKIVNVASVPHRSPFRYPGGKTWLVPTARKWLKSQAHKPKLFIEPFTGGGIIGLTVAFEELASRVLLIEKDEEIAVVWQTILGDDNEWLASRILGFDLTEANVRQVIASRPEERRERAFRTILRNRTQHGGILAPGASLIKTGENGKGLRSRWYAGTIAKRIRQIRMVRDRIQFVSGDSLPFIEPHLQDPGAVFFVDPPYTAAGKQAGRRLYTHHELDHARLFMLMSKVKGDFLMTYDHANHLVAMANEHHFATARIAMKNTHHAEMTELLIGRNFDWLNHA